MKCSKCGSLCYAESDNSSGMNIAVSNCCKAQIIYIQHHNIDYSKDMFQSCSHPNFSGHTGSANDLKNYDKNICGTPDDIKDIKIQKLESEKKELLEAFEELLNDSIYLYNYYPNNFRATTDKYFKSESELLNKHKK